MKKKFGRRMAAGLLLALGLVSSSVASAKDTLLAEAEVLYKGNTAKAQLWGNKVTSSYANNLTLVLKRADGGVITGYKPDVKGGYGASLKAVQVKAKDKDTQQLLLEIRQGDWRAYSEYRLLDIANPKELEELFAGSDNFGLVTTARLETNALYVQTVKDKEPLKIDLNPKMVEDIAANRRRLSFSKLQSLVALDIDGDSIDELFTNQQLTVDNRILADVGAVWRYIGPTEESKTKPEQKAETKALANSAKLKQKKKASEGLLNSLEVELEALGNELKQMSAEDKQDERPAQEQSLKKLWHQEGLTIMKSDVPHKQNTINDGAFFYGGMVYPVKLVAPNGEATYPQIMLNENVELEKDWNKVLMAEADKYLRSFLQGRADIAFNVIRADEKLVTLQLIAGKDSFLYHNISFIPGQKGKYELKSLLAENSKGLAELLNTLNNNAKLTWDTALTDEWYLKGDELYLMKNVNGKNEIASFALKNLQGYIKDKRFLPEEAEPVNNKEAKKG